MSNPGAANRMMEMTWMRLLVGVWMCGAPVAMLGAQTSDELTGRIVALRSAVKTTQQRIRAEQARQAVPIDDSITVEGVTVFFPERVLGRAGREALRDGVTRARQSLDASFGEGAARLLDGDVWSVTFRRQGTSLSDAVLISGRSDLAASGGSAYEMPLKPAAIERYVMGRAGRLLMQRNPVLNDFAGGSFSFRQEDETFYVAQRQLILSKSSVARRCAGGALGSCRTILNPAASAQWFTETDSLPQHRRPFPAGVHGTLVSVAIDLGGARGVAALSKQPTVNEPILMLANAAGVTPDSLLLAWMGRLNTAGATSATPSSALTLSAFFWSGLLLLAATRRRPQ